MNRYIILLINVSIIALMTILICFIYNYHKRKNTLSNGYSKIFCICIFFISFLLIFNAMVEYDIDGNAYFFEEYVWKNGTYTSIAGNEYYIDKDQVINKMNKKDMYSVSNTYLTDKGLLLFDENNEYYKSAYKGVYINNERNRVYSLDMCQWSLFGKIKLPESQGIYIKNSYIKPMMIDSDSEDELARKLSIILDFIIIWPCLVISIKYLYLIIKKIVKVNFYKGIYHFYVHMFVFLQIYLQSILSKSFLHSLIIMTISSFLCFLSIFFLQGKLQKRKNGHGKGYSINQLLREVKHKEVFHISKQYLFIMLVDYILWLGYTIIVCIGKI